ncbi:MAG: hypothetical protein M0R73_08305 [Dehalococcoidia bacterium]|nr:hypothetical protein [Dehalococcoidia bacterium]
MDGAPSEALMRRALEAAALDASEVALASGAFHAVLLLADRAPGVAAPAGVEVIVDGMGDPEGEAFHFGHTLRRLVRSRGIEALAYLGAGSGGLLGEEDYQALVLPLIPEARRCVTNNRFSADLFALRPASLLSLLDPAPEKDNAVPRRLREEHGIEVIELPRTLATQFNMDTPNDLVALALSGRAGPRLRAVIAPLTGGDAPDPGVERVRAAARHLIDRTSEVLVAGRVSSRTWQYLETEAASRIRLLAEERGMQAAGTDVAGTARSMLGALIAEAGAPRAFGSLLPELARAAFLDIRPALVHLGIQPSRADRFAADLGRVEEIEDARLREIVAAANTSPIPVVLGGHSLVGGCLELLNQWAWDEHDGLLG